MSSKRCLICKRPNDTIHHHEDKETGHMWLYCVGKCQRGYSLREYCHVAGIPLVEYLKGDFDFVEAKPLEVNKLEWPASFISLSDPRANAGVEYLKNRGINPQGDIYYDLEREGIVFAYYFQDTFCGAQTRLLKPWTNADGDTTKILTLPGTRLGMLLFGWNQKAFFTKISGLIICEGAINVLSIQQSLNKLYGGILKCPWKVVATSGAGISQHQIDKMKELKDAGIKVVSALDGDEAGLRGLNKLIKNEAITHFALTGDSEKDWNDFLVTEGDNFARFFLNSISSLGITN